ncbi:MAG: DMT family transporter [Rickettsiaceae bacterium]|nr:DMT family transporter [Rickettsiaceae bacterium]
MSKISNYFLGVCWFLLSLLSSVLNDTISKYFHLNMHPSEIAFLRFFFSFITLVPFVLIDRKKSLQTSFFYIHLIRGSILFLGMSGWIYGLGLCGLATATLMSFTIPLFTLILAYFFLEEQIIWQRWVATIIGFIGVAIALGAGGEKFEIGALLFAATSIGFAMLDIINKKFVKQETMLSMLFYSAIVSTILSAIPALPYWRTPDTGAVIAFTILGASANLILFFLLRAFRLLDASALAPYRYLELFLSSYAGYYIFNEIPDTKIIYGALIVIPSTLFIIYSEKTKYEN